MAVFVVAFNGVAYGGWKEVSVTNQFDEAVGEANVTMSMVPEAEAFPCQRGDEATVTIDGTPVVTGNVHTVSGSDDWQTHDVQITIRDKTQDLVSSTIGPKQESKPPVSLKTVCEDCIKKMGLKIGVVNKVQTEDFRGSELIKGWLDDGGHAHLDRHARARQALLTTDGKGNLVIDRNEMRRGGGFLFRSKEDNPANNIKKSSFQVSEAGQHNKHSAAGQKSANDKGHWESKTKDEETAQSNPMAKNVGDAFDTAVRPERAKHYRGKIALEGKTPEEAAKWRASVARGRGVEYSATVAGVYDQSGGLWWPGVVIPVADNHWKLAADMFLKSITFRKSWSGGEETDLKLTEKDAYSKEPQASTAGSRTAEGGIGYTKPGTFTAGGGLEI